MKRNLFRMMMISLLTMFVGFVGCNSEDVDFKAYELDTSVESGVLKVAAQGGEATFDVISNRDWTITVEDDISWIVVDPLSGSKKQTVTVNLLPNSGLTRHTDLKIELVGGLGSKTLKVEQAGEQGELEELYRIKFGTSGSEGNPLLNEFKGDLQVTGTGASESSVSGSVGSSEVSIRTTGKLSDGYPGASGMNLLFLGKGTPEFIINKVATNGNAEINYSFGASQSQKVGDNWDNEFKSEYINVYMSTDGENFTGPLNYDFTAKYSEYWVYATGSFAVPSGAEHVYMKFVGTVPSRLRMDDVVLSGAATGLPAITSVTARAATDITETTAKVGGSYTLAEGAEVTAAGVEYKKTTATDYIDVPAAKVETPFTVELTGLSSGVEYEYRAYITVNGAKVYSEGTLKFTAGKEAPSTDAIYFENAGTKVDKVGNFWPYPDQFEGWSRQGSLDQSDVVYSGFGANVSNSGASFAPAAGSKLSNAPYIGMNYSASNPERRFQIDNINVTGKTNFTYTFGALFQSAYPSSPVFGPVTENTFALSGSIDGENWTPLTYTVKKDPAGGNWYYGTSEFKVPEGTTKLSIKYLVTGLSNDQGTRVDDFTLVEGGNGTIIIGDGGEVPAEIVATATAATDITETSAKVGGTYTLPSGKTATEAGVGYKKVGDASYTFVSASAVTSPFTVSLTGLTASTTYEYVAYVTVDGNKVQSKNTLKFATKGGGGQVETVLFEDFSVLNGVGNPYPGAGTTHLTSRDATEVPGHEIPELPGWSGYQVFAADGAVKMGGSSAKGFIVTPPLTALTATSDVTVTFLVGAWPNAQESSSVNLSLIGAGTLSATEVTDIPIDGSGMVERSVTITGADQTTRIVIEGRVASRSRFFIDDFKVVK